MLKQPLVVTVWWVMVSVGLVAAEGAAIFEKREWWGPCPQEAECHQTTMLNEAGLLTWTGRVNGHRTLDRTTVQRVIEQIRASGLMAKPCPAGEIGDIVDYGATYTFRLDGRERQVQFPDCQHDLYAINALMPAADASPATPTSVDIGPSTATAPNQKGP